MQHRLMTEYQWRKLYLRSGCRRSKCWGAQCIYPRGIRKWCGRRGGRIWLLACAVMISVGMIRGYPPMPEVPCLSVSHTASSRMQVRTVKEIHYVQPEDLLCRQQIWTRQQLVRGSMLWVDETHALPVDYYPPNTASIAQYGKGNVPVRSLKVRCSEETIDALQMMFHFLREKGADNLFVCQGTLSAAQQKQAFLQQGRQLMQFYTPDEAAMLMDERVDRPGTGSLLLGNTVDIQSGDGSNLAECPQGQMLLRWCWRFGFVRERKDRPDRFRYVGKAHATAMTYLDLDLKAYLEWLHLKECLCVYEDGQLRHLILCQPMKGDYAVFQLPECRNVEVSMDNMGYALAACTF